jgi:hypothetical protein
VSSHYASAAGRQVADNVTFKERSRLHAPSANVTGVVQKWWHANTDQGFVRDPHHRRCDRVRQTIPGKRVSEIIFAF